MKIEKAYDNIPYHRKESCNMPYRFYDLSTEDQCFFRDFYEEIIYNKREKEILVEDLEMMKADLEAVIARIK